MDATWGAIEIHRADAVTPLVKLWVTLQPDASLAHEMRGWIYMIQGEKELAAEHLRRALALDPESRHAERLLHQLSR
jgi:Tfp pilus assembly protein PilF